MYSEMEAHAEEITAYTGGRSNDSGGCETYAVICRVHGARLQNFSCLEKQNNLRTKRVGRQQLSH